MSGIDEQDRDVTPCSCEGFEYWTILDRDTIVLGFLNPDAWINKGNARSINRLGGNNRLLSKDDFIGRITFFQCDLCKRVINKKHRMFVILLSEVRRRWDVGRVRNR